MNLQQLLEQYVAYRQALGERFLTNACILRAFGRSCPAPIDITDVTHDHVRAFLDGTGPITSAWHKRYSALRGFYRYALSRGYVAVAPLPAILPQQPPAFVPYIYTREDLQRLLAAADSSLHPRSCLEPATLRTVLLLLYGTGLRVREALALNRTDVDLDGAVLTVRRTKFFKTRWVPFGRDVGQVLARYARQARPAGAVPATETPFFTTRAGGRLNQSTFTHTFRRVCEQAGIRRHDGARYQPRLHDLRHTFALHRLTSWYQQGADVQRLLPQLSVYLGHTHLAATQVYLSMTPELLHQASLRFEHYAVEEPHHD